METASQSGPKPKDRGIIFSAPMVRALLDGRKTQTRRLATSPLRHCAIGDRLYVRETAHVADAGYQDGSGQRIVYRADDEQAPFDWTPSIYMHRFASRLTLIVEGVKVEPLRAIRTAEVLAEGAPLDPNHHDCTQDGSNPHMCKGDRPWTSQSPHAWYHRLWDRLHTKPGERWEDNPQIVALTFRVVSANIDRMAA